jgi:hypothetical protein
LKASGVLILGKPSGNCKSFLAVFRAAEAQTAREPPL